MSPRSHTTFVPPTPTRPHSSDLTRGARRASSATLHRWRQHAPAAVLTGCFFFGACTPPPRQAVDQKVESESHPEPQTAKQVPPPSGGTPRGSTPVLDRSQCGLPLDIVEADWPRRLEPTSAHRPSRVKPGTRTLGVLPDTQYYASCRERHFAAQTRYLAENEDELGLLAAVHLGDLTEHNSPDEWRYVQDALALLPPELPALLATGNHDYGVGGVADERDSLFDQFLGHHPRPGTKSVIAERMKPDSIENAYYRLPWGEQALGVLVLEWSPRKKTVAWAAKVLDRYPEDRIVFVTHAYLFHDDTRYDWAKHGKNQPWNPKTYGTAKQDPKLPYSEDNAAPHGSYDGQMLWAELLSDHGGVFLTLNGHVLGDGTGLLSSRGKQGNLVHQVLVNYQMLEEGGLGYLRLIEIAPDGASLHMTTYSPSLGRYATAPDQDYELRIDPPLGPRADDAVIQ